MTLKVDPFLGLGYGEDKGSDNWNIWMDTNLTKVGMTVQIGVKSATTTTPAAVVNGERWLIPAGATGAWASNIGKLACALEGTYTYVTPNTGWRVVAEDTSVRYFHNGVQWLDEDDYGDLPALIACAFPFLMTNGQAISLGANGNIPAVGQTATYTIEGSRGSSAFYFNGPEWSSPQIFDISTGKKVIEWEFTGDVVGGLSSIDMIASVYDGGTSQTVFAFVLNAGAGEYYLGVLKNAALVNTPLTVASLPLRVGFEFDSATGEVVAKAANTPITLSDNTYDATATALLLVQAFENAGVDAGDAGKTLAIEVFTSAGDFSQTWGGGATDICGNSAS